MDWGYKTVVVGGDGTKLFLCVVAAVVVVDVLGVAVWVVEVLWISLFCSFLTMVRKSPAY